MVPQRVGHDWATELNWTDGGKLLTCFTPHFSYLSNVCDDICSTFFSRLLGESNEMMQNCFEKAKSLCKWKAILLMLQLVGQFLDVWTGLLANKYRHLIKRHISLYFIRYRNNSLTFLPNFWLGRKMFFKFCTYSLIHEHYTRVKAQESVCWFTLLSDNQYPWGELGACLWIPHVICCWDYGGHLLLRLTLYAKT